MPTCIQVIFADTNPEIAINGVDDYRVDVDVAVIDTGVDFQDLNLNVVGGVNCYNWLPFIFLQGGGDDDHYHDTDVAGPSFTLTTASGLWALCPARASGLSRC